MSSLSERISLRIHVLDYSFYFLIYYRLVIIMSTGLLFQRISDNTVP
jgi:hypothetical protein